MKKIIFGLLLVWCEVIVGQEYRTEYRVHAPDLATFPRHPVRTIVREVLPYGIVAGIDARRQVAQQSWQCPGGT